MYIDQSAQYTQVIISMRKWFSLLIGGAISVVIFVVLIGSDLSFIRQELAGGNYSYLIPGIALFVIGIWTRAMRWRRLLNQQISVTHSFHIMNIGYFLSGILPLRLGDVARAWLTTRLDRPISGFRSLSTIVVERLLDLLTVLAMLGLTLLLLDVPPEVASAGAMIGIVAVMGTLLLALFAYRPVFAFRLLDTIERIIPWLSRFNIKPLVANFIEGLRPMSRPRVALDVIFWTAISWLLSVAAGYVFLFVIFDAPTLEATLAYIVLASFSVALPAVPGNLGPFEGAVVGGLWIGGLIGAASSPANAPAVAFAAILHATQLGIYIVLGLIGLFYEQATIGQIQAGSRTLDENHQTLSDLSHERAVIRD